jgi:hypothetical protein
MAFAGLLNPGQEQVGFRDLGPGTMRIWYKTALQKQNSPNEMFPRMLISENAGLHQTLPGKTQSRW